MLFVGINPGLWTAATHTHFAYPGNRFYPALLRAGIITAPIDPAAGMTDTEREMLRDRGIGITNVAPRATAKASELSTAELKAGGVALTALVEKWQPRVVAVAGWCCSELGESAARRPSGAGSSPHAARPAARAAARASVASLRLAVRR